VFSQGVKVSSRLLCTAKPPNDNNNEHKEKKNSSVGTKSFYETWKPHTMKIGMGAAASLTLYGLSSFMWDMTYNIMTMSPASGIVFLIIDNKYSNPYIILCRHVLRVRVRSWPDEYHCGKYVLCTHCNQGGCQRDPSCCS
jgi:hypothetical protein